LVWDDFCSWYLEWIKPAYEGTIATAHYKKTIHFFEELVQLLHPFIPFITEEIYHQLEDRVEGDDLCIKQFNAVKESNEGILKGAAFLKETITSIRDLRVKNGIKPKEPVKIFIESNNEEQFAGQQSILAKQVNAASIEFVSAPVDNSLSVVIDRYKLYVQTENPVDNAGQKEHLLKDLDYLKGFLLSVEKKLSNERFVANAKPEVVEVERSKKRDAEDKIRAIEESLSLL
jgi:valyl-tRNA synthetase